MLSIFHKRQRARLINRRLTFKLIKMKDSKIKLTGKPKEAKSMRILDNSELLQIMYISARTAQTWRDTGILPYSKVGKKIYYDMRDVEVLLERTRVGEPRGKEVRYDS